jgi:uncharacterized membrane protein
MHWTYPSMPAYKEAMEARARLAISIALGAVALVVTIFFLSWQIALLVGWDSVAVSFIVMVWASTHHRDSATVEAQAVKEDDTQVGSDLVLVGASVASLVGVAFVLLKAASAQGAAHTGLAALAVASVLCSWASVHTVFTLRYARLFYTGKDGGIDFHATGYMPTYGDFLYVALTIGMTFQVSDTDLTSREIRRAAVRHALLSYLFGVVVVAITINVVASLLTK